MRVDSEAHAYGAERLTVGDLFGPCDQLPPTVRLGIVDLLDLPASPPAVLPGQLPGSVLPANRSALDAIVGLITSGCSARFLATIADRPFAEIVPAMARLDAELSDGPLPARVADLAEREGCTRWRDLALSPAAIQGWKGAGPGAVVALLGAAMTAIVDAGEGITGEDSARSATQADPTDLIRDLELVLHNPAGTKVRTALEKLASAEGARRAPVPEDVANAARRLIALPAPQPPADPRLVCLDGLLAAGGELRDRAVFAHLDLSLETVPSAHDLAAAIGVGPERIRQLRSRCRAAIRAAFDDLPADDPVRTTVADLGQRLGAAVPLDVIDPILDELGLPPGHDLRAQLVVHLAGPYRPVKDHPGWVATDPAGITTATGALLRHDGGVRLVEQVLKELDMLGIASEPAAAWMLEQPVRLLDGLVVLTAGTAATVCERALDAAGHAITTTDLATWTMSSTAPPPVDGIDRLRLLLANDRRFNRVGPDEWELTEWGGAGYTDPEILADDDPFAAPVAAAEPDADGVWRLALEVTADLLAGGSGPVPAGLLAAIGIRPDHHRTFASRYGPVTFTYDAVRPTHGSVRPIARASGCVLGDTLILAFRLPGPALLVERQSPAVPPLPFT